MVASDGTVSVELFTLLIILYAVIAVLCATLISRRTREVCATRDDLRECTDLLIQAHRELKLIGNSDLSIRIERYMRKRLHNANAIEVTP